MSVCLDAFALLAWLQNEPGAELVEDALERAAREDIFHCFLSVINLGEVYYRLLRLRGSDEADGFWEEARKGILPVTLITPTPTRVRQAARLKANYPIAYADAFAVQLAQERQVPLLTGDPELKVLEQAKVLALAWLTPY
ncbi:MAG TPA: type II toxin-antitoxin system VapC family toxin [Anaerolineae bacterium]|nr:type II toxin-antitoxin system VapC family toxin [Anaerolineae bacterium]